ncbi:hypothetical protein WHR41_01960 [Cladosporium halotolerans]|uniref:Uncharacterized protein n=1 Tax=Cladosporium halotolerans TaxID=1052096 RepID=A0AB34L048_9PEZI
MALPHQWAPNPQANNLQQNHWNNVRGYSPWADVGPRRRYPREEPFVQHFPGAGWYKGDLKIRKFKPKYYWTRPNDGKRCGTWGRLKDALTNEGPDVFVTINSGKRTLMRDRPQKWQWSRWPKDPERIRQQYLDPDAIRAESVDSWDASWTKGSWRSGAQYNFRTRKYEHPSLWWGANPESKWMDAQWKPGAKRSDTNPLSYQRAGGTWFSRVPLSAGLWPGGRPLRV